MKALLVIDMIRGFTDEGALKVLGASNMIPYINKKIQEMEDLNKPVFYIRDNHSEDDYELKNFPTHCLYGTEEARPSKNLHITEEAYPRDSKMIVSKQTIDCFYQTDLDKKLWNNWVQVGDEVGVVGVVTELCVDAAVRGLAIRGYKPIVFKNGITGINPELAEATANMWINYFGVKVV